MVTIDQVIAEKLNNWTIGEWPIGNFVACTIALLLSAFLSGLIGIERERKGRSAGLRTHLLVGVGSCIIMIISIYGFPKIFEGHRDVARLAAQVIAGIGFLGAGAIIHRNSGAKGLTTAATIWLVMAIGLACGSMNFILAITGTLFIIVILTVFKKFEKKINKVSPIICVRSVPTKPVMAKVLETVQMYDSTVHELRSDILDDGCVEISFLAVSNTNELDTPQLITSLEKIDGITYVGIINGHK